MTLLAEDGTVLKAKEGVVLDSDGHALTSGPIHDPQGSFGGFSAGFSLPIPAIIGAVLFIPLALTLGAAFISVIAILLAVFFVMRTISRILR